jgi:hypothetical protein
MNTQQQTTPTKNKGGRPRKDKQGKHLWIPAECLDVVIAILETTRKQQAKQ